MRGVFKLPSKKREVVAWHPKKKGEKEEGKRGGHHGPERPALINE